MSKISKSDPAKRRRCINIKKSVHTLRCTDSLDRRKGVLAIDYDFISHDRKIPFTGRAKLLLDYPNLQSQVRFTSAYGAQEVHKLELNEINQILLVKGKTEIFYHLLRKIKPLTPASSNMVFV